MFSFVFSPIPLFNEINELVAPKKPPRVGIPICAPKAAPTAAFLETFRKASKDALKQGVRGQNLTPFLLKRIFELTEGKSLVANIALVENNAAVAAEIAVALAKLSAK